MQHHTHRIAHKCNIAMRVYQTRHGRGVGGQHHERGCAFARANIGGQDGPCGGMNAHHGAYIGQVYNLPNIWARAAPLGKEAGGACKTWKNRVWHVSVMRRVSVGHLSGQMGCEQSGGVAEAAGGLTEGGGCALIGQLAPLNRTDAPVAKT
jgi:hypothetical protein